MEQEEVLQEIKVLSKRIYPGRSFEELTPEEQEAVFQSYEGERDMAGSLVSAGTNQMANSGHTAGPLNVYYDNPWESLAGGLTAGVGYGMQRKANKAEALGRKANADMVTRRDAQDREYADRRTDAENKRRDEWLARILGK